MKKLIIAIDGPAASGKSTTARRVASALSYLFIDTGAMYRALAVKVLENGIDPENPQLVASIVAGSSVRLRNNGNSTFVELDGKDITGKIRQPEVTRSVSAVSRVKEVRDMLVQEQRLIGRDGGVVAEGRDIGTVVFPGADLKIFMIADAAERAKRRAAELRAAGIEIPVEKLMDEIIARDIKDSARSISPLRKAPDAVVLDTSHLTIDEQVESIILRAKAIIE